MHRNTRGHLGDCSARRGRQAAKRWGRRHLPALLHELPWLRISAPPILASQDAVPAAGSVLDMLLRAINKETGHGLTDVQIASQANTLIAGAAAAPGTPACMHPLAGPGQQRAGQSGRHRVPCEVLHMALPPPLLNTSTPRPCKRPSSVRSRLRDVSQRAGVCCVLPSHSPRGRGPSCGRDKRLWRTGAAHRRAGLRCFWAMLL